MIDTLEIYTSQVARLDPSVWPAPRCSVEREASLVRAHMNTPLAQVSCTRHGGKPAVLRVQANLPKLLHGHNVEVLDLRGVRRACVALECHLVAHLRPHVLSLPQLGDWQAARVDYVGDWLVANPSAYVVEVGLSATPRGGNVVHRWGSSTGGHTVGTGTKSWKVRLYDKQAETRAKVAAGDLAGALAPRALALAAGRLRLEVEARRAEIKRWLDLPQPTLSDVLADLAERPEGLAFERWSSLVRSWAPSLPARASHAILGEHSAKLGRRVFETWAAVSLLGVEEYRRQFKPSASTWRRFIQDITDAGVGLGLAPTLPRLDIALPYVHDAWPRADLIEMDERLWNTASPSLTFSPFLGGLPGL